MPTPRPRKPTDATIRNAKASATRDSVLLARIKKLEARVSALERQPPIKYNILRKLIVP